MAGGALNNSRMARNAFAPDSTKVAKSATGDHSVPTKNSVRPFLMLGNCWIMIIRNRVQLASKIHPFRADFRCFVGISAVHSRNLPAVLNSHNPEASHAVPLRVENNKPFSFGFMCLL
jgi:hypothetical protein